MIIGLDDCSPEEFYYNARQLYEDGLIHIQDRRLLGDSLACWATGLTPKGHRALEDAENEFQRKVKAAAGHVAQVTFESVLSAILDRILKT